MGEFIFIFISNDHAPLTTGWIRNQGGGFNSARLNLGEFFLFFFWIIQLFIKEEEVDFAVSFIHYV